MKISVNREVILAGLQRVQNIVGTTSYLPCLSNVKIEAKDGVLSLFTSNTDISISTTVTATITKDGNTSIPAKKLLAIIKEVEGNTLTLEKETKEISTLQCGKSQFKLHGLPVTEFPPDPKLKQHEAVIVPQSILRGAIKQTIFAASTDEARFVLNGALLELSPDNFNIVTTDGRRLALVTAEITNQLTKNVVIPTKTLAEVERLLNDSGDVEIAISDNLIAFKTEEFTLTSKLVEGTYPNYRQVIPQAPSISIELDRAEFMGTVKRVGLLSNADKSLKLSFTADKVLISTNSPELGEAKEPLDIKYSGKDTIIAFNPVFLLETLKHIPGDKVTFNLIDEKSPGVFKSQDFLQVLMPMRVEP